MNLPYVALAVLMSLIAVGSGVLKLRRDPKVVKVIHEIVGVPLKWLPWLAACEFAGALGLLIGILSPPIGVVAALGLLLYFVGAVVAHVRVGDFKGLGPAAFLLMLAGACLVTRALSVSR